MSAARFAACAQRWRAFTSPEGNNTDRDIPKPYRGLQR